MGKINYYALTLSIIMTIFVVSAGSNVINVKDIVSVVIDGVEPEDGYLPVVAIAKEHFEIHEGEHYFIKTWVELSGPAETTVYFAFNTPENSKEIHAKAILAPDADTIVNIFENCTITGGTIITPINNKRDSTNNATLIPYANPTVNNNGTLIWAARNGGGKNPVGVAPGLNYEIIAKNNVTYCFEIEKETVSDTIVDIDFFWYEEDAHE